DLIRHFLSLAAAQGLPRKTIDADGLDRLRRHNWPGNVRELENLAQRLAALYAEDTINGRLVSLELDPPGRREDAPPPEAGSSLSGSVEVYLQRHFGEHQGLPPDGLYDRVLEQVERPLLVAALVATKGNQIKAAKLLGLNRNTLRKKIKVLNVSLVR
ncbi:MAG: nitrogen regulation protein NR(I), partial [Bryobacterales bacterium]|nr:nitrogen regulation protein NR(I) [Bryobacterales bacterium]